MNAAASSHLPEDQVAAVKPGAAAQVRPVGRAGVELMGSVRVSDLPTGRNGDGPNLYEVRVQLAQADPRLRAGMRCKVAIHRDGASR